MPIKMREEDQISEACRKFLEVARLRDNVIAFHVPNETLSRGMALKNWRLGVVAGVPDWIILIGGGQSFGIELKTPKEYKTKSKGLSKAQKKTHGNFSDSGVPVYICCGVDQFAAVLQARGCMQ